MGVGCNTTYDDFEACRRDASIAWELREDEGLEETPDKKVYAKCINDALDNELAKCGDADMNCEMRAYGR